jgi:hypothetical protein
MGFGALVKTGNLRPDDIDPVNYGTREEYLAAVEKARREMVQRQRSYFAGTQYDARNAECLAKLADVSTDGDLSEKAIVRAMALFTGQLPEHLRLHEYSTQIGESVDFIAGRLSKSFQVEFEDDEVSRILDAALDASPELSGSDDDAQRNVVNVVREACTAGDTAVLLRWDPVAGTGWFEFWQSDTVELRFREDRPDEISEAIVLSVDWRDDGEGERLVSLKRKWVVRKRVLNAARMEVEPGVPEVARMECAEEVYRLDGSDEVLVETHWWGVPFVPWWPLRARRKSLHSLRGDSLVSEQAMRAADRYNANEQVSWLIARYNSHANLVVWGDAAVVLKAQSQRMAKDVADVLILPGAEGVESLSLPTDAQMIEHQRAVLRESLFGAMGLAQIDQESLEGLGGVTGYALEILNEKSGQTLDQIRNQLVADLKKLFNMMLDATAYWQLGVQELEVQPPALGDPDDLVDVDSLQPELLDAEGYVQLTPETVYANRQMTIEMGSGYIVDDVKTRDDYTAKLISQEEALRKRGYGEDEIKEIIKEQEDSAARSLQRQSEAFGTGTEATARPFGRGTQGGNATGSTVRGPENRQTA